MPYEDPQYLAQLGSKLMRAAKIFVLPTLCLGNAIARMKAAQSWQERAFRKRTILHEFLLTVRIRYRRQKGLVVAREIIT